MATLAQLEGRTPPLTDAQPTFLVRRCTELMSKELDDFATEDLRIMLGQQLGVPFLLPRAVDLLLRDPLAGGELYPGDLLIAVLRLPRSSWDDLPTGRDALTARLAQLDAPDPHVRAAIDRFLSGS